MKVREKKRSKGERFRGRETRGMTFRTKEERRKTRGNVGLPGAYNLNVIKG